MTSSYWSRILVRRVSRRRAIATAGAGTLAAAFLAACGGGSDTANQQVSGLITEVADTSKQAQRGGVYKDSRSNDINSWDPFLLASPWNTTISALFQRMTIIKPGYLKPSSGEVEGNIAESWEFSGDRLTLTFRLRPNQAFHQIAPVNGRAVDVQDILYSWNRFLGIGTSRSDYANNLNPKAPITSLTAPDSRTIVLKLAYPMATLPALLSYEYGGHFHILPRELESGAFDLRNQPIGSGPWAFVEHRPSAGFAFKRHEGYYDKERPYIDRVEVSIIPEYAAGLAQFKAGSLHRFGVRAEDVLVTKQDVPRLALYKADVSANTGGTTFGWRPTAKNVFRDVRVRQAFSMAIDRDLFIEVGYNVSKFEQAGLPVETRWNSALYAHFYEGWWLDPRSKEFGENGKYFKHDIAEAKKLMSAAGLANGVDVMASSAPDNYGQAYAKDIEVIQGFASEAGFRFQPNIVIYNTEFQPKYRDARGDFEGVAYKPILGGDTDAVEHLLALFSATAGPTFTGLDPNGKGDYSGDPYIEDQLFKARGEIDSEKRRTIVQDVQRHLGKQQYLVRHPGGASGLDLAWPAVKNRLAYRAPQVSFRGGHYYEWLDQSLPPFKGSV